MVHEIIKYLKQGWLLFSDSLRFFVRGIKENSLREHFKAFFLSFSSHLGKFHFHLQGMKNVEMEKMLLLSQKIKGLHFLLPDSKKFHYSLLIDLDKPSPALLKSCLSSICLQSAPNKEILLGFHHLPSKEILTIIHTLQNQYPHLIHLHDLTHAKEISIYNVLSKKAKGNYLVFVEQDDWLRPDFLYRYEQLLRSTPNTSQIVINCFENQISENDDFIPGAITKKTSPNFPFVVQNSFDLRGVLLSKSLWDQIDGLRKENMGAEATDLFLRLDIAGATFSTIPFSLYSRRKKIKREEKETPSIYGFISALENYIKEKKLNWRFWPGYLKDSVRVIPQISQQHRIQVIIPFKDQKDLTLRCVKSVLKQNRIDFTVTAIDNGSADLSIAKAIEGLGCEVIKIDEPFNYSRLNNLAVAKTKNSDCSLLLFLNNDVELDANAFLEMARWIDLPSIGMVGARLHYPDGKLQHGGIHLDSHRLPEQLWWEHKEKHLFIEDMRETKVQSIVDAVTCACALIKKETFLKIGGFNELCYPTSYSDTYLASQLNKIGLKCFYNPYAFGIHHESLSRKESLDDVEASRWLHQLSLNIPNK